MDVHSPQQRSFNMSRIKGKGTKPEKFIRKWLWSNGYRFRRHKKEVPGKPDIVFPGRLKIIFVHGCFWHRHDCKFFKWPATNAEFWKEKIESTVQRDKRNYRALSKAGWEYLIIWECETKGNDLSQLQKRIIKFLESEKGK